MKFSIVMAYHNRRPQFLNTLKSFEILYNGKYDYEVVVVDDASDKVHRLDNLQTSVPVRVSRIPPKQKTYINPCIPFNKAFRLAKGEILVLQNPENIHLGDVLGHVDAHLKDGNYLVYSCLSLDKERTERITQEGLGIVPTFWQDSPRRGARRARGGDFAWYVHPQFNPRSLHFLSAIKSYHVREMGGFDERYKNGCSVDDREFALRIKRKGLQTVFVPPPPLCFHQSHPSIHATGRAQFRDINRRLFTRITQRERAWRVNGSTWSRGDA